MRYIFLAESGETYHADYIDVRDWDAHKEGEGAIAEIIDTQDMSRFNGQDWEVIDNYYGDN